MGAIKDIWEIIFGEGESLLGFLNEHLEGKAEKRRRAVAREIAEEHRRREIASAEMLKSFLEYLNNPEGIKFIQSETFAGLMEEHGEGFGRVVARHFMSMSRKEMERSKELFNVLKHVLGVKLCYAEATAQRLNCPFCKTQSLGNSQV